MPIFAIQSNIMATTVSLKVSQSADGFSLTLTDNTNYSAVGSQLKTYFSGRSITLYKGSAPAVPIVIPFPFTGTANTVLDTVTYPITEDGAFSATVNLVPVTADGLGYLSQVIFVATELCEINKRKLLAGYKPIADKVNIAIATESVLLQAGIWSAIGKAQRGDIQGAYNIINFVQEQSTLLLQ